MESKSKSKSKSLFSLLPFDIIREILLFDSHFVIRPNQKIVCIHKISKKDSRYQLIANIPKINELGPGCFSLTIKKENKIYIHRYYLRPSQLWEYSFTVFSKDTHTNMMDTVPYSLMCIPRYRN
jgi:hypothetical protein